MLGKKHLIFLNHTTQPILFLLFKRISKIDSYDDLKGKTVGVKNGTASQTFLEENQKQIWLQDQNFL